MNGVDDVGADGYAAHRNDVKLATEFDPAPPAGDFPNVSVTADAVPSDHPSELEVVAGLVQHYGPRRVAKIQIDVINAGTTAKSVEFLASPPFSSYRSEPSDQTGAHAFVAPSDRSQTGIIHVEDERASDDLSAPVDGCWKIEDVGFNDLVRTRTIQPDHVISERYSVYADASNDDCLPSGDYRFEESWTSENDAFSLEWGFSIAVEG